MKILFIGYGRMGSALGAAWRRQGLVAAIDAIDPQAVAPASGEAICHRHAGELAAGHHDLIVLAVKPGQAAQAVAALGPERLARATAIVSIMAGVSSEALKAMLAAPCAIVRAMPNTPVLLGAGCTGLYTGPETPRTARDAIHGLFAAVGSAHWVDTEEQLHAVTALSGSGPAYFHLFAEALAKAGVALGLAPELARALAAQTALGAALQQAQPGADFQALRQAVTSPQGTTHAAIQVLEENSALRELLRRAAVAASDRSRELMAPA